MKIDLSTNIKRIKILENKINSINNLSDKYMYILSLKRVLENTLKSINTVSILLEDSYNKFIDELD